MYSTLLIFLISDRSQLDHSDRSYASKTYSFNTFFLYYSISPIFVHHCFHLSFTHDLNSHQAIWRIWIWTIWIKIGLLVQAKYRLNQNYALSCPGCRQGKLLWSYHLHLLKDTLKKSNQKKWISFGSGFDGRMIKLDHVFCMFVFGFGLYGTTPHYEVLGIMLVLAAYFSCTSFCIF